MKKNLPKYGPPREPASGKLFRIMRLSFIICFVAVMSASANVNLMSQKVTLEFEDVSLVDVLRSLKDQTGHMFIYSSDKVQTEGSRVTMSLNEVELSVALDYLFEKLPYTYEIEGQSVMIIPEPAKSMQQPATDVTITGRVTDSSGNGLHGATVVLKGTTTGVQTDAQGRYSLRIPNVQGSVLSFSYLGKDGVQATYTGQSVINAELTDMSTEISDVVVTGYFNQSAASYTGSARTISGTELLTGGNMNVLKSLSTIDPSMALVQNNIAGSNPNVLPEFNIRGQSTIAGLQDEYYDNSSANMPLFILDGFAVKAERIYDLDIYRIESITILKDASATAIYGSRAANGVVVVTTKAPPAGKLIVNYNADVSFTAADLSGYDLLNAEEKLALELKSGMYSDTGGLSTTINRMERYYSKLDNVLKGYDTDWLNKPLDKLSVGQKHSLSVEGGSEIFRYQVTGQYNNTPGAMKESGRVRQNLGMKFIYSHRSLRFSNEMSYISVKAKNSPYGSFEDYTLLNPYNRYKDDNGNILPVLDENFQAHSNDTDTRVFNPLYNSTINTRDESSYNEFRNNFGIIWDVAPGISVRGNLSVWNRDSQSSVFKPAKHTDFGNYTGDNYDRRGSYTSGNGRLNGFETTVFGTYQKRIDKHLITGNLGWDLQQERSKLTSIKAEGFPNENLDDMSFALQYALNSTPEGYNNIERLVSFVANANYMFDERYMVDFSGRMDGSSKFGANKRWAPLWSVGIGWNLHKEHFLENAEFLNRLKIRASIGETGSTNFSPSQSLTTYEYLSGTRYHFGQGTIVKAMGNEDLSWQRTLDQNIGLDLSAFGERLQMTADFYIKKTSNMLVDVTLAPSLGFPTYKENLGEVENSGYSIYLMAVPYQNLSKGIRLGVFGNFVHNKNKLKKISNSLRAYNEEGDNAFDSDDRTDSKGNKLNSPRVRYIEGQSIHTIWANKSLGIDPATGEEIFQAIDGSIVTEWSSANVQPLGCGDPKLYGTFGLNFNYQKFQFNCTFKYSIGGDIYNQTIVDKVQDADLRYNVDRRVLTDRWEKPGDISKYTKIGDRFIANWGQATRPTSRFIEKENYLELASVNASYDWDAPFMQKIGMQRLRFTFYMEDVFRSSTVKIERGTAYPFARTFSLGVQATF